MATDRQYTAADLYEENGGRVSSIDQPAGKGVAKATAIRSAKIR